MATRKSLIAAFAALTLAGCSSGPDRVANVVNGERLGSDAEWTSRMGDAEETGYSRLDQIDTGNVDRLGLEFAVDLPGETTLEGTPLAVDGVVYFPGTHAEIYAVDGKTGKRLWKYDPQTWKFNPFKLVLNFAASRGLAYASGKVFVATMDGRLVALDAKTGDELWTAETLSRTSTQWISGAPYTFKDKVVVGQAGADNGERGYVTAYDQATGEMAWRFYPVPGSPEENKGDPLMEKAAGTWYGEWWKGKTGGGPWGPVAFDEELNLLYIGSANPGQVDTKTIGKHKGDQLFASSIIALDPDTGEYVWHYQVNPRDAWDYGSNTQITLADLMIDGKPRKVLMQAPKNGFLYVIDRESGKFISAGKIVKVTWAEKIDPETGRPVEAPNIRFEKGDVVIWPNPIGAHNWHSQAFSPKTGLIYIPAMHNGVRYSSNRIEGGVFVAGMWVGSEMKDERDGKGSLVAWDPVSQKEVWRVMHDTIWNGGVMATAGNLVFQGDAYGKFAAYDSASGKEVWSFDAGLGIIGAPMSYAIDGKQYVAILVGWGGSASMGSDVANVGWKYGANTRRLLVFALDGKQELPSEPGRSLAIDPIDDPAIRIDPAAAEAGKGLFLACALCHGRDVISAGSPAPDLRESVLAMDPGAFRNIVKDGALIERGMPRYDFLNDEQVAQLYHYIRREARRAKDKTSE
ncbi:MAG: PQQ-dependent dehydrogenase, methanol/ethanol family [Novosphingobium sp.]|nr:PQQ-dependent dehydrogenase, methanol/ethanol family [Novosphingobium sp.]